MRPTYDRKLLTLVSTAALRREPPIASAPTTLPVLLPTACLRPRRRWAQEVSLSLVAASQDLLRTTESDFSMGRS